MGRRGKKKHKLVKCAWCGKEIELSHKGRLRPHYADYPYFCTGSGMGKHENEAGKE